MLPLPGHIRTDVQRRKCEEDLGQSRDPVGQTENFLQLVFNSFGGNQLQTGPKEQKVA